MADVMNYSDMSDGEQWYEDEEESGAPDSVLLSLVQSYDWAGALARIASHPDGAFLIVLVDKTAFRRFLFVSQPSFHLAWQKPAPWVYKAASHCTLPVTMTPPP